MEHNSVSSENIEKEQNDKSHTEVSSEGIGFAGEAVETDGEFVSQDFLGEGGAGELENVLGFDPARADSEGLIGETVSVTEEDEAIPSCYELEFESPESVCGRDDRIRISPASRVPWRWNCQLIITMANGGTSRCTGWFIGPHTVMTAGHCVYSHGAGGWAKKIEVIPGMDASSRPFGSQIATSLRSVVGWTKNKDWNYDYGAIILPNNNLGNRVGWFGFAVLSGSGLKSLLVNNAGYAGDKPYGTLWFNAGRITKVTARKIYYMIDTAGGHSGSPVWRYYKGRRHAVGIHAYGGCPNSASRISKPVFNNMVNWRC